MRETTVPEAEIAGLLQSDEPAAQERGAFALHRRYSAPLMQYIQGRGGVGEADAADVLNLVLYRAVRRIHTITDVTKLSGWLYRLAHNAAMDWHRKQARQPSSISLDDPSVRELASPPAPMGGDEGQHATADSGVEMVRRAMARLSERDQQVLIAIANDLTNEEIAAVVEVTPAHARVLRHRAVERLRLEAGRMKATGADQILEGDNR
jgi:RNA polymerase sigma factor (sigma-70 family)